MIFTKPKENSWHGPQGPQPRRVLRMTNIKQDTSVVGARFIPQPPPKPPKPEDRLLTKRPQVSPYSGLTPARGTKDGTDINKTLPAINETTRDACKFPHIGGANGRGPKSPEQADRKHVSCYENFLQDQILTNRRSSLLNRHISTRSSLSTRGLTAKNIATLDAIDTMQESLNPIEHQRTTNPRWSAWVSEYEDKFGYSQRMYPPRIPQPPPRPPSHYTRDPFTLFRKGPKGQGPWSEYQANYHKKV